MYVERRDSNQGKFYDNYKDKVGRQTLSNNIEIPGPNQRWLALGDYSNELILLYLLSNYILVDFILLFAQTWPLFYSN